MPLCRDNSVVVIAQKYVKEYCASCVSLRRQEESHSTSFRTAELLTVSCDQVHKVALLKQTCLIACCGLLLLRSVSNDLLH